MTKNITHRHDSVPDDDRRQNFRVDVPLSLSVDLPLALSYESVDPLAAQAAHWQWNELAVSPDLVKGIVAQADLATQEPLLLQLLVRIDWLLTSVMKTLGKDTAMKESLPEFMTANLSGSGIRFPARREYQVGGHLALRIVLRPFVPIQAVGKVLRVYPVTLDQDQRFETACVFTEISADDREAIIRHILRSQAILQRRRSPQEGSPVR